MATAEMEYPEKVRLNDLDWALLTVMADDRRYTPKHLYADIPALDEWNDDWIRRRIKHLHDNGLIEHVGSSSMYVISEWGKAALVLREEYDTEVPPKHFMERIIEIADQSEDAASG